MENRNFFIEKPEDFRFFLNRQETDILIRVMGYHNFCVIAAQKTLRRQDCHTVHIVLAGSGTLIVEGKKYSVSDGDVFYVDDKSTFAYYPDENDPWEYVFFEFNGDLANSYVEKTRLSVDYPVIHLEKSQVIKSLLLNTFSDKQTTYFYALSVFLRVMDEVSEKKKCEKTTKRDFIEELKSYIRIKYLDADFSIDNLCKTKYISHSHLCRIFKSHEGISPVSYVKKMRLTYAASLLKNTDYSLKKIAIMSGFNEYEYFFRSFKKHFGVTPTEYKKSENTSKKGV